jgi:hypothetical protein
MQMAEEAASGYDACCKYIFENFRCFRGMFQLFHTDVAKLGGDAAYVATVVYVSCKLMSPIFHLFF